MDRLTESNNERIFFSDIVKAWLQKFCPQATVADLISVNYFYKFKSSNYTCRIYLYG